MSVRATPGAIPEPRARGADEPRERLTCEPWPWERAQPVWTRDRIERFLVEWVADRRVVQFSEQRAFIREIATQERRLELCRQLTESHEESLATAPDPLAVPKPILGKRDAYAVEEKAHAMIRQCWNQLGLIPSRIIPAEDPETGQVDAFATVFPE